MDLYTYLGFREDLHTNVLDLFKGSLKSFDHSICHRVIRFGHYRKRYTCTSRWSSCKPSFHFNHAVFCLVSKFYNGISRVLLLLSFSNDACTSVCKVHVGDLHHLNTSSLKSILSKFYLWTTIRNVRISLHM